MEAILDLYTYLYGNKTLKDELIINGLNEEKSLLSALGIVNDLIDRLLSIDPKVLINESIKTIYHKFDIIEPYLVNEYGQINALILHDILINEYDELLNKLKEILNI